MRTSDYRGVRSAVMITGRRIFENSGVPSMIERLLFIASMNALANGELAPPPPTGAVQRFSTYRIMRRRVSESGKRPRAAPMFSRMWSTLDVAGMAQVTAGWETMNLRKN